MHDLCIPKSFGSILKAQSLCAAVFRSLAKIKLMKPYLQLLQRKPILVHSFRRAIVKTEQHVPSPMLALHWCAPDFQWFCNKRWLELTDWRSTCELESHSRTQIVQSFVRYSFRYSMVARVKCINLASTYCQACSFSRTAVARRKPGYSTCIFLTGFRVKMLGYDVYVCFQVVSRPPSASGSGHGPRVCWYFQKGNCTNGINCPYLHAVRPSLPFYSYAFLIVPSSPHSGQTRPHLVVHTEQTVRKLACHRKYRELEFTKHITDA